MTILLCIFEGNPLLRPILPLLIVMDPLPALTLSKDRQRPYKKTHQPSCDYLVQSDWLLLKHEDFEYYCQIGCQVHLEAVGANVASCRQLIAWASSFCSAMILD